MKIKKKEELIEVRGEMGDLWQTERVFFVLVKLNKFGFFFLWYKKAGVEKMKTATTELGGLD